MISLGPTVRNLLQSAAPEPSRIVAASGALALADAKACSEWTGCPSKNEGGKSEDVSPWQG